MTREEMIEAAKKIRLKDNFGVVSKEELETLLGEQREFYLDTDNGCHVHIYELKLSKSHQIKCPLLINFHGGGFIKGRLDRDRRYCSYLLEHFDCIIWDVDYCLAPENPYPAALNECYGVAAWAFLHGEEMGIDVNRIAFAGHSAGANLTAAICIHDAAFHKLHPCALLMEYMPADHTADSFGRLSEEQKKDPWFVARAEREAEYMAFYCEKEDAVKASCSPLLASDEQLSNFPDCLVLSAGHDTLCKETEKFAARLIEAGVTVTAKRIPEAMHGFTTNRTDGWERALKLHCEFLNYHFKEIVD